MISCAAYCRLRARANVQPTGESAVSWAHTWARRAGPLARALARSVRARIRKTKKGSCVFVAEGLEVAASDLPQKGAKKGGVGTQRLAPPMLPSEGAAAGESVAPGNGAAASAKRPRPETNVQQGAGGRIWRGDGETKARARRSSSSDGSGGDRARAHLGPAVRERADGAQTAPSTCRCRAGGVCACEAGGRGSMVRAVASLRRGVCRCGGVRPMRRGCV